ncbi:DedA family protein [Moraxella sp. FZLJ2107]|uniref:DedA family protein n=1 Tax=unclassified Moraxella TaxID=2685852 RepID=UPI0020C88B89|nr:MULTISPECIES: DedA family protein [unclassified Moraxella]UTO04758.1 DedA family protein [Moraxella sp. FZLJ2107]UTO21486.1 DedA family protein [Moraxella sp. FZLJ2109]
MTHLSDWVLLMMDKLGLFGVALMMFLENVFPPIPSELIMPAAGFAAAMGRMELWLVIAAGTAGSVIGALPLYYLGTLLDEQRLFALTDKYGKYLLLTRDDIIKAQSWFDRYGNSVIFFGRMIPAIRSLISIPAGMARMPMLPFLLLTTLGSAIWSALLAYAGFVLGANYQKVADYIAPISSAVGWIVGVALLFIILIRLKKFLKN